MISTIVYIFFKIIYLIILTVVILSWIPIFDVRKEPLATLVNIYKIIMAPFRFIPPIGMVDISPLIAFILLQIIENLILRTLAPLGL